MRIFITGGTGFVGRWLVPLLEERGHELLVMSRNAGGFEKSGTGAVRRIHGDLQDIEGVSSNIKNFKPKALVHLAWEGIPDYSHAMCRRNLEQGLNILSFAHQIGCSIILSTGSCWEYACRKGRQREDASMGAKTAFQATKNALRLMGEAMAHESGIRFYWLRLFYVYGPGQRSNSLIPCIIESIVKDEIPQIQTPSNRNDFVFVEDVARAIARVLETLPGNIVYNVGSGYSTSVNEMARTTYNAINKSLYSLPASDSLNGCREDYWADISRIKNDTSWAPVYDLPSGIKKTIEGFVGVTR